MVAQCERSKRDHCYHDIGSRRADTSVTVTSPLLSRRRSSPAHIPIREGFSARHWCFRARARAGNPQGRGIRRTLALSPPRHADTKARREGRAREPECKRWTPALPALSALKAGPDARDTTRASPPNRSPGCASGASRPRAASPPRRANDARHPDAARCARSRSSFRSA
jgi:hypothetical protein